MTDHHRASHHAEAAAARWRAVAVLCLVVVLAWLAWIHRQGQPVAVPAARTSIIPCLSYAPFRRDGHTPFDAALVVTPAQIEQDLRILARVTRCVRTYGVDHGLDAVPAVAQRLGLRVALGAWIGRDAAANASQIDRVLALSDAHRATVAMVIVGNEVLLRRELDAPSLARLLADARQRSPVPVAYADVWEFWLRHGTALRDHVDVIAIHVLPYWEDDPVHVRDAVAHVRNTVAHVRGAFTPVRGAFAGKPVWLAESGWPAAGRQRGPAAPGVEAQTRFVRGLLDDAGAAASAAPGLPDGIGAMNLIEGFDQPWKRALEGAVGGHWGVFDARGQQRLMFEGAVVARRDAVRALWLAAIGGVLGAALVLRALSRRARGVAHAAAVVVAASAFAGLMAAASWQWQVLDDAGVGTATAVGRAVLNVVWLVITLACGADAAMRLAMRVSVSASAAGLEGEGAGAGEGQGEGGAHGPAGAAALWRARAPWLDRLAGDVHLAWLALTATLALQLVFDARYRDVSWPLPAAAAGCVLLWRASGERMARGARRERALALLLALCAALVLWQEGVHNMQAWSAVFTCAAAALSVWWPHREPTAAWPDTRPGADHHATSSHTETHASRASTAAGADQSAP